MTTPDGMADESAGDVPTVPRIRRRRLSKIRRDALRQAFPPRACSAHSARTGLPCRKAALVGAKVCPTHGGSAPNVRADADKRLLLAEAMLHGRARSAAEILLDHQRTLDAIATDVKIKTAASGEPVDPYLLGQLIEATKTSAQMSKVIVDLGVEDKRAAEMKAMTEQLGTILRRSITDLPDAVQLVIRCRLRNELLRSDAESRGLPAPAPKSCSPMPTPWTPPLWAEAAALAIEAPAAPVLAIAAPAESSVEPPEDEPDEPDDGPDLSAQEPPQRAEEPLVGTVLERRDPAHRCSLCTGDPNAPDHGDRCAFNEVRLRGSAGQDWQ